MVCTYRKEAFEYRSNNSTISEIYFFRNQYTSLAVIGMSMIKVSTIDFNAWYLEVSFLVPHKIGFTYYSGFWPESYLSTASEQSGKDQYGVNVWIALDDMKKEYRGSMALSRGSHRVPWRFEAYQAIGQNRSIDGGRSKESIVRDLEKRRRTGEAVLGACQINLTRPDLRALIEERGEILDVHKGDVIFSTRTLFHKTIDVTEEGAAFYESIGTDVLNRYSIRYAPGSARLPNGWLAEWSAVSSPSNIGRTLDEISEMDDIWYPKVWPVVEDGIDQKLNQLAERRLKSAKEKVFAEIMELFVPGGGAMDSASTGVSEDEEDAILPEQLPKTN